MLGPARTSEHGLGALVRPPFQFGDGDEGQLALPNQPQLGLDVPLEGVQGHAERERSLPAAQRNPGNIRRRGTHGRILALIAPIALILAKLTSADLHCPLMSRG
jgi:hypothetical protein